VYEKTKGRVELLAPQAGSWQLRRHLLLLLGGPAMAQPNIVSVRCTCPGTGKHCRIGTAIESRLCVEYLAIANLMPFGHQDRSFSWGFGLKFDV
jgi:hypothetical protein